MAVMEGYNGLLLSVLFSLTTCIYLMHFKLKFMHINDINVAELSTKITFNLVESCT